MRRFSLPFAALFVLPLCGSDSPRDYDDKVKVNDPLEGTWGLVLGMEGEARGIFPWTNTYCLGKSLWETPYGNKAKTYRVDPRKTPAHLDETFPDEMDNPKTIRWIYQIDGDTLKIALCIHSTERPHSFDEKEIAILTFKRLKK